MEPKDNVMPELLETYFPPDVQAWVMRPAVCVACGAVIAREFKQQHLEAIHPAALA